MSLTDEVKAILSGLEKVKNDSEHKKALEDAERLSDQFADVKPVPFVIPISRLAGLPCKRPTHQ